MPELVHSPMPGWDDPGDRDNRTRLQRAAGVPLQDIAATLGVTAERVRQVCSVPVPVSTPETVLPGTAERISTSIPPNTARAYRGAWSRFERWCRDNQRSPLPTSAAVLADYTAYLCDLDRAPATIAQAMAVIATQNHTTGHPALGKETTAAARLILRGHRKTRAKAGHRQRKAAPADRDRIRLMSAACDRTTLAGKRDRLLLVIGYALAGRRSEIVALQMEDVLVGNGDLDVLIRASKTDQDAEGVLVNVPAGEHVDTDPVGLLRDWLDALTVLGVDVTTGPLFRAVTKDGRLSRHAGITGKSANEIVKRAALRAGLPNASTYSTHSLRAGFATTAANAGVPVSYWATHGRWSLLSPVPNGYVRVADARLHNPLRHMGM